MSSAPNLLIDEEMMRRLSIGWRLTLSYLAVFAVAQFLFGFGMWLILRHNLYEITDDALAGQVDDVQRFLEAQKKDASTAKLQEEVTEAYVLEHSGDYLQVYDSERDWIYRASFLQRMSFPPLAVDQPISFSPPECCRAWPTLYSPNRSANPRSVANSRFVPALSRNVCPANSPGSVGTGILG